MSAATTPRVTNKANATTLRLVTFFEDRLPPELDFQQVQDINEQIEIMLRASDALRKILEEVETIDKNGVSEDGTVSRPAIEEPQTNTSSADAQFPQSVYSSESELSGILDTEEVVATQ